MSHGKNIPHDSAYTHVTGKSVFIDDRVALTNEVFVGLITSKCAKGIVKNIDFTNALEIEGVYAGYTAEDFMSNTWGSIVHDQALLAKEIEYFDEVIAILACENREVFEEAKDLVLVEVEELYAVLSIDEAIEAKDFHYEATPFEKGDIDKSFENFKNVLEGDFYSGGQEHFYLESQASVAYPLEDGGIEVHSSSQHYRETSSCKNFL